MMKILLVTILWMADGSFQSASTLYDNPRDCIEEVQSLMRSDTLSSGVVQAKATCIPVEFDPADGAPPKRVPA